MPGTAQNSVLWFWIFRPLSQTAVFHRHLARAWNVFPRSLLIMKLKGQQSLTGKQLLHGEKGRKNCKNSLWVRFWTGPTWVGLWALVEGRLSQRKLFVRSPFWAPEKVDVLHFWSKESNGVTQMRIRFWRHSQPQNSLVRISGCNQVSNGEGEPGRGKNCSHCNSRTLTPLLRETRFP